MSVVYSQFSLTDKLANSISTIVSKKEGLNYVCVPLKFTVPKHVGLVFMYDKNNAFGWNKETEYLDDGQIHNVSEKDGKYIEDIIPELKYEFLVIIEKDFIDYFSKIQFKTGNDVRSALDTYCKFYIEYHNLFDYRVFCKTFPYLKDFFEDLILWRTENNKMELDDDVLSNVTEKTLSSIKQK